MKVGDRLQEKYSDELCTVESVHSGHVLMKFDSTGFSSMVREANYKYYRRVADDTTTTPVGSMVDREDMPSAIH